MIKLGKGVERGNKRVYTFTLDKEKDELMIRWLETQSTTAAVIEGLKLVMTGASTVNGVVPAQNTEISTIQANQINQLINLLTISLTNNTMGSLNPQLLNQMQQMQVPQVQFQETEEQQAASIERDTKEPVKEKEEIQEEEFGEEALAFAEEQAKRFQTFDPSSFGS